MFRGSIMDYIKRFPPKLPAFKQISDILTTCRAWLMTNTVTSSKNYSSTRSSEEFPNAGKTCAILLLFLLNLSFWLTAFGYTVNKESLLFGACTTCLSNSSLLDRFDCNIHDDTATVLTFGWIIWSFHLILSRIYGLFIIHGYLLDKLSLVKQHKSYFLDQSV